VRGPILAAGAYYAGGVLGLQIRTLSDGAVIWPPNALLLGALLLAPVPSWWRYLAAVFLAHAHLTAHFNPNPSDALMLLQFAGNALQALLTAAAVRALGGVPPGIDTLWRMTVFIAVAALAVPAAISLLIAYPLVLVGWAADYWLAARMRLLTNVFTTITLTSLIVAAGTGLAGAAWRAPWARYGEFVLLVVGLIGVGIPVFGWTSAGPGALPALLFAPLPFLIWGAVRFGPGGTALALLTVAVLSLSYALAGHGPFVTLSRAENVVSLQMFLIALALPLMLLAALTQERRQAQRSLRESEARFRSAFDDALIGMAVVAVDGRLLRVNRAFCDMVGYATPELLATTFQALTHADDVEANLAHVRRTLAGEQAGFQMEKRYHHRRGHLVWVLLSVSLVRDADGRPLYFVSQVQDITERKRGEEALRTSRQEILTLAGRLISAHEEERRRIARELHDDLGQDVAALAIFISNLRRRPALPPAVLQTLGDLLGRTNDLAVSLRELSHELHPAWIEHVGLVSALKSFAAEFGGLNGLEVALTAPDEEDGIPADVRICIFRVVQESVRNVARHSGAMRAEVVLRVADDHVQLRVRDAGRGFDVASIRPGVGLGLSSIAERVRLVRGRAEVMSTPGVGTEVAVTIPLSRPASRSAAADESPADDSPRGQG
jgi:PAS domain S-box-containing protein